MNNIELGAIGESEACSYLESMGYRIMERNYRCKLGELDIIAADNDTIAFIEVKTRTSNRFGQPSEAVSFYKQNKIVKSALYYVSQKGLFEYMCRFDVVEVTIDEKNNSHTINLIQDAFQYSGRYGY